MPVLPEKRFIVACARLKRLVFAIPQESGLSPAEICKLQSLADVPYDPKAIVSNVAGSVALFPDCFRRFVRVTGWPLHEAVKAAGYNQLRSLGILGRGEIAAGQIADLVLVDESLSPRMTIVGGEVMRS